MLWSHVRCSHSRSYKLLLPRSYHCLCSLRLWAVVNAGRTRLIDGHCQVNTALWLWLAGGHDHNRLWCRHRYDIIPSSCGSPAADPLTGTIAAHREVKQAWLLHLPDITRWNHWLSGFCLLQGLLRMLAMMLLLLRSKVVVPGSAWSTCTDCPLIRIWARCGGLRALLRGVLLMLWGWLGGGGFGRVLLIVARAGNESRQWATIHTVPVLWCVGRDHHCCMLWMLISSIGRRYHWVISNMQLLRTPCTTNAITWLFLGNMILCRCIGHWWTKGRFLLVYGWFKLSLIHDHRWGILSSCVNCSTFLQ